MDLAEEVEFKLLPQDVVTRALFLFEFAKSVLLNYGNFQPSPVPVAEGLPGPKDCDTEGACWWFNPGVKVSSNPFIAFSSWRLTPMLSSKPMGTHWLPHYTQPSPQQLPDSPYLFGTSLKEHKPFPPS
jgi:hypothetical protein